MLNVIAVAHVGLTAALLPIPEAFQVAGALAWSAAIAVKGMALVIDLDLRTAGASLALGFLATVLVLAVVPVNGLAAS
jgi:hypothetical protein